jgi:ABC-2 type transport system ATP-binding protein
VIEIRQVTRRFGSKTAVDRLTLTVRSGEVYAFIGPNGAGKTTTIKMIAGLLRPNEGQILVEGFDVQRESMEVKRRIAYVPDQPFLYDKLTGREFLRFIGQMYGMDGKGLEVEIESLIELFGMGDYIDELTETYSHGMRQRVVLSAGLVHRPRVIVVDEPMVGLDPQTANLVKRILRQQAGQGCAVFMSTHVLAVAEVTADRVGVIHRGRLIAEGSVGELRRRVLGGENLEQIFLQLVEEAS